MHITKNIFINLKDKRNFKLFGFNKHIKRAGNVLLIWYHYKQGIAILVSSKSYNKTTHSMYSRRNRELP